MSKAEVCIVESLPFLEESSHREGEILSRTLLLSGKPSHYTYVRSKRELKGLVAEFKESDYRYMHISCHGNETGFATTLDFIKNAEMVEILAPAMQSNRRLFMSSCYAADTCNDFAKDLLSQSKCLSVIAPTRTISFSDAAIFWSSFYHLMFKHRADGMGDKTMAETIEKCAGLISEEFCFFRKDTKGGIKVTSHPAP